MSQNNGGMSMSNFNIGDVVRIGKGKVEYVVSDGDVAVAGDLGTHHVTVESMNTGKAQTIAAGRLTLVATADTEPMNTPQDVELSRTQVIAESTPAKVTVPEFYNRPEDAPQGTVTVELVEETGEAFDPREDRRQSAYGLAILAQVLRKNPVAGAHNVNPLKPIGSKRTKVRRKVRAQRTALNNLARAYNTVRRVDGYNLAA